ncbi:uncharacterized protein LOC111674184 [Orussus abietinus]|uniref:uncharacterized protein LOC111674184 n=1 Tax=Orussus abietinus TaxID=222816 RepID=UPI000C715E0B|nr:uncharacterized protein LOC111674184 [Orussus abietinus]
MSDVFKPVVSPLKKLVNETERNLIMDEIKREVKRNDAVDESFESPKDEDDDAMDESFESTKGDFTEEEEDAEVGDGSDDSVQRYLDMLRSNKQKTLDTVYGVRKLSKNRLMIGDASISFEGDRIHVGDTSYVRTVGLMELLFKKVPDETDFTQDDLDNYREIIVATNAYRKYYTPHGAVRGSNISKFRNIIVKLIDKSSVVGEGVVPPRYMIAVKNGRTDYVYWDDPNELVDRLRLLLASQEAGWLPQSLERNRIDSRGIA